MHPLEELRRGRFGIHTDWLDDPEVAAASMAAVLAAVCAAGEAKAAAEQQFKERCTITFTEIQDRGIPPQSAGYPEAQAYHDVSTDTRDSLSSFFAYRKCSGERDAFQRAHMTLNGMPGVLNLAVVTPEGNPIPFAPFRWQDRQLTTGARGMIEYIERPFFQTTISMENEHQQ